MGQILPRDNDVPEAIKVLNFARSGIFGRSIEVSGTTIRVTRLPDTKEIRDEHECAWRIIFGKIYENYILRAQRFVFQYPASGNELRDVEARDVDFIFADTGALRSNLIAPCVFRVEYKRLLNLGVVFCPVPEAEDLGVYRLYVHAARFLKIVL